MRLVAGMQPDDRALLRTVARPDPVTAAPDAIRNRVMAVVLWPGYATSRRATC